MVVRPAHVTGGFSNTISRASILVSDGTLKHVEICSPGQSFEPSRRLVKTWTPKGVAVSLVLYGLKVCGLPNQKVLRGAGDFNGKDDFALPLLKI